MESGVAEAFVFGTVTLTESLVTFEVIRMGGVGLG